MQAIASEALNIKNIDFAAFEETNFATTYLEIEGNLQTFQRKLINGNFLVS